jgi:tRNA threonylcarbamoyladenosine biosynthesis protein TsaB
VIVLGFDTATPATAVGLRLADGTTLQAHDIPGDGERPGHATRLLPLADQLLAQAGIDWGALQRIAVGVGPGTFTGLRVGVATARGLAQSLAIDLVGVSSLRALAHHALREGSAGNLSSHGAPSQPLPISVLAAIDARRGEVFAGGWSAEGELFAARALAPENLGDLLPHVESWLAVGDGAVRYRSNFEGIGVEVPRTDSALHCINGAAICELALHVEPTAPQAVLPDYLRRPDAEIALQGAAG